jgi:hypothetical protein
MAKPRPERKRERKAYGQLPLPTPRSPAAASATRVLPIDLKVGDRLVDETGEWEVVSGPYTLNAGKNASVRVKKIGQPEVTEIRLGRPRADRGEERRRVMARRFDRPGLLLWLNTAARIRARMGPRAVSRLDGNEATVRPEDTLRAAGISSKRQAKYQRRLSRLLARGGT